mgnify:CR=1 FL=1
MNIGDKLGKMDRDRAVVVYGRSTKQEIDRLTDVIKAYEEGKTNEVETKSLGEEELISCVLKLRAKSGKRLLIRQQYREALDFSRNLL